MMFKILSCNIRDSRAQDGDNAWPLRADACIALLQAQQPDIIAFQEMRQQQRDDISAELPNYASSGLPELADAPDAPNAIFWRRDKLNLIESSGFWLSATPEIPGSLSWGCQYIRLANAVRLQDRAGRQIRIINTHLDDSSQHAREQQAALLCERFPPDATLAADILCGDLNCTDGNAAIDTLLAAGWRDSWAAVHDQCAPGFTYHGFEGDAWQPAQHPDEPGGRIDWIFVRGDVTAMQADVIRSKIDNRYPSDHYPVSATLAC